MNNYLIQPIKKAIQVEQPSVLERTKIEEQESIKESIADLELTINIAIKYNQELQPKFQELSNKKSLLEKALKVSKGEVTLEVQIRDLWNRCNKD